MAGLGDMQKPSKLSSPSGKMSLKDLLDEEEMESSDNPEEESTEAPMSLDYMMEMLKKAGFQVIPPEGESSEEGDEGVSEPVDIEGSI